MIETIISIAFTFVGAATSLLLALGALFVLWTWVVKKYRMAKTETDLVWEYFCNRDAFLEWKSWVDRGAPHDEYSDFTKKTNTNQCKNPLSPLKMP